MRALSVVCGIAVLLNALHFVHAIHHFLAMEPVHGPGVWAGTVFAILVDLLCFAGGFLLIRSAR